MIMVDTIGEFRCWPKMAVTHIEVPESFDIDVIVYAIVARFAFLEFVGTLHLDDVHVVVITPKSVDRVTVHCNTNNC